MATGMNGAAALVQTLVRGGVDVCFANPGTSEMHFVAALDQNPEMRCVLCLFEGVATGAADGYARMAGRPAVTLLHLGPGLANASANMHNARKARTPMVNVIGEHATYHVRFDAPLTADIEGVAAVFSDWVRTTTDAATVAADGAEAIRQAVGSPGGVSSLILPADTAWGPSDGPAEVLPPAKPAVVPPERIAAIADVLRQGEASALFMHGPVFQGDALDDAGRIAKASGAELLARTSNTRIDRGAGRVAVDRVPYPVDQALDCLRHLRHCVCVGTPPPVAFFGYPGKPSEMLPPTCTVHTLAHPHEDMAGALAALADELGAAGTEPDRREHVRTDLPPAGELNAGAIGVALAALMPDDAIVVDESISLGAAFFPKSANAAPHSWLQIVGGSIGDGLPLATGAAIGGAGRKVITLQADGSAMYTLQALWTQARENLDVVTIILANRAYAILQHEMRGVGVENPGQKARDMFSLERPTLDWVGMAKGMGVEAERVDTAEGFNTVLAAAIRHQGPFLIEAVLA